MTCCDAIVEEERRRYGFDPVRDLCSEDLDHIYEEREAAGKRSSHRTYIGTHSQPEEKGLEGHDKLPVRDRYDNLDSKVTFECRWATWVETTCVQHEAEKWQDDSVNPSIG